jgi:hypothetical protein
MNKLLFEALKAKYKAEELDALARLSVYSNNAVGIGEHPQITEEMDKLVQQYVDSIDKFKSIIEIENRLTDNLIRG